MPRLYLVEDELYNGMDPYHVDFDNKPIKSLLKKLEILNDAVDLSSDLLRDGAGTQGTISNRINQSIDEDGNLKDTAVDEALHSIGAHTEGLYNGTEYVVMTKAERDKLTLIADEATSVKISFDSPSSTVTFDDTTIVFEDSDTVSWSIEGPNKVQAVTTFPLSAAHNHFYNLTPVHANIVTPDYTNYKVTSMSTPFMEGSLRVCINGIYIPPAPSTVYVPPYTGPSGSWTSTNFTPDFSSGTFELNRALVSSDVITIDFDTSFE